MTYASHIIETTDRLGNPAWVEATVAPGLPSFMVIGHSLRTDREARDRIRTAMITTGTDHWPQLRISIEVRTHEGNWKKWWTGWDKPAALAIAAATGTPVPHGPCPPAELGLDGSDRLPFSP